MCRGSGVRAERADQGQGHRCPGRPSSRARRSRSRTSTRAPSAIETKTNKKGEYIQVGLYPGEYRITVTKDALTDHERNPTFAWTWLTLDFKLEAGGAAKATGSKEDVAKAKAKAEAMTKAFSDGVALSNEGKTDEAIAKFNEVIAAVPNCAECYANIGTVQGQAKKYDEAEAAYKKAIELKPDFAEAYNGLANVYNAAKKFDLAAEASKKAMELASAPAAGGAPGAPAPRRPRQRVPGRSTRASFSGTPARFPRRRRSSRRR